MSDDNVEWLRDAAKYRESGTEVRMRACADELADLRKENERLTQNLDGAMNEVSLCHRLMERNEAEAEATAVELRSIRDRLFDYQTGRESLESIIAAAKASKEKET